MDLFAIGRLLLRRWAVVVPIVVVTVVAALWLNAGTPGEYEARGYVLLESPQQTLQDGEAPRVDPLDLSESVQAFSPDAGRNLTITRLGGDNYSLSGVASSSEDAVENVEAGLEALDEAAVALQEANRVPEEERIRLRRTSPQVFAEDQGEGRFVATTTFVVDDPARELENPYPPTVATGRLLQIAVTSDAARAEMAEELGDGVTFDVGQNARDAAPLLEVVATAEQPGDAVEAYDVVVARMGEDLQERQDDAGVLTSQRVTIGVLSAPMQALDVSPPVSRLVIAVLGLGGLIALAAAFFVDRRRNRAGDETSSPLDGHIVGGAPDSASQDASSVDVADESPPDPVSTPTAEEKFKAAAGPSRPVAPNRPPGTESPDGAPSSTPSPLVEKLRRAQEQKAATTAGGSGVSPDVEGARSGDDTDGGTSGPSTSHLSPPVPEPADRG